MSIWDRRRRFGNIFNREKELRGLNLLYPSHSKLSTGAEAIGAPLDTLPGDAPEAILSPDSLRGDDTSAAMLGVSLNNTPESR